MGIAYYVSAVIVLCFILSTVSVISGDTSVNCTTFDNNTCCNHVECFYVNCTSKENVMETHLGCHAKTDVAGITAVCMNGTDKHICDGPEVIENSCNVTSMDTCCNTTDCVWLNCTDKQDQQQEGCFNSSDVTCTPPIDLCNNATKTTTTVKPTTTTTVKPTYKECQDFTDVGNCCSEEIWSCIYVNCSGFQGCFSKINETNIKANCKDTYLDACAATTPVPISTTTAPSTGGDTGRHFDTASFIGGIVLCAGIVLIIFFALKWYRSRQATNNYHQM